MSLTNALRGAGSRFRIDVIWRDAVGDTSAADADGVARPEGSGVDGRSGEGATIGRGTSEVAGDRTGDGSTDAPIGAGLGTAELVATVTGDLA
jgi:hypothetical protein